MNAAQQWVKSIEKDVAAGNVVLTGKLAGKTPRVVKAVTAAKDEERVTIDTGFIDYMLPLPVAMAVLTKKS